MSCGAGRDRSARISVGVASRIGMSVASKRKADRSACSAGCGRGRELAA
jgi:hypothetical protein